MKLSSLLMLLFCMNLSAGIYAQEARLSVSVENSNIREIIRIIKQQSDYTFVYNVEELDHIGSITMNVKDSDVRTILDACLKNSGYTYSILDKVIVIRKAEPQQQEQIKKIRGTITDKKKVPLPGVTVLIKGTTTGVSTDMNGKFEMVQPKDSNIVLLVSFIGMKTQTIPYKGQDLTIVMEEDSQEMEEVVVTGYQVINKKKSTSAITSVKMDDIMIPGATSIDQMLEGRVSDMILMTNSGEVGVAPKIRIRGTSTLVGNREPLWVVDGIIVQDPVPISSEELNDPDYINRIGNAIAGLNPQDIERLDILKDAAATALYGTKAANGVIVITTKKGRVGDPIISYNMTTTFRQRPRYTDRKINVMNSRERIQLSRELFDQHYVYNGSVNPVGYEGLLNDLYNGKLTDTQFSQEVAKLETMNTDWFKLLTEDTFSHQHTVSISGGSEKTRYYSSIGFSRDNDVIKGNYNQRYTASLNVETTLTKWFTASFQMQGNASHREYNQDAINPMDYAYNASRAIPAYDENGNYAYYKKMTGNSSRRNYNILNELENSYTDQHTSGITVNANLKFNFTNWLNANAIISYTNSNAEIEGYWGEETYYAASLRGTEFGTIPTPGEDSNSVLPFGGELTRNETRSNSYTARLQVNANKYFGADEQHNINASAGFELSSSRYNGFKSVDRGYYPDRGKMFVSNISISDYPTYGSWLASNVPSVTDNLTNMLSGYATLSYSYQNYFTVNVNARVDGSNKFGDQSNNKFLPIWSASGAYNISEHDMLQKEWIDYITLKVSFGYQGNMLSNQTPELIIKKGNMNNYFEEYESNIEHYPNPNLRWEKTGAFNGSVDFALLDNRIRGTLSYFYKKTKDAFLSKTVADINGVETYVINSGTLENKGFEISFNFTPFKAGGEVGGFRWDIDPQIGQVLNTLLTKAVNNNSFEKEQDEIFYTNYLDGSALIEGEPLNTFFSYKFMGLSPEDGRPMYYDVEKEHEEEYLEMDREEVFRRVMKVSGTRVPVLQGGVTNTFSYKRMSLSLNFAYSFGSKIRLMRLYGANSNGTTVAPLPERNVRREFVKRWQRPGDEKHTNIPGLLPNSEYASTLRPWWKTGNNNSINFADNIWQMYDNSDIRTVSGNYLKLQSFVFNYTLPDEFCKKLLLKSAYIGVSGSNLFTICSSKLKGQDPTQSGTTDQLNLSIRPSYSVNLGVTF